MRRSFALAVAVMAILFTSAPRLADAAVTQVETPLGCVNTIVAGANAPTGPAMVDGGAMTFRDNIAPGHASITGLYIAPGSYPVASTGQHVRVCFLDIPKKQGACDPAHDPRGREFLVINLEPDQLNEAQVYTNAEHGCGGA